MSNESAAVGFQSLPIVKQVGILVGLSASIALGFYVVLWSKGIEFTPLSGNSDSQDVGKVIDALQRSNIPYQIDNNTGLVMVPIDKKMEAKMKLAQSGINFGGGNGFELLDKEGGIGTSQFIESTRYLRAMQGELERTISGIHPVKAARVHLAIPKATSFARNKQNSSASVLLNLYPGYNLETDQIGAIVHLVASSVQGLSTNNVTVIDQNGHLLSRSGSNKLTAASQNFSYARQVEKTYSDRIYDLLTPLIGEGKVKAEVTAVLDFTSIEETVENFDDKKPAIRNEKIIDIERSSNDDLAKGIPGALSNQSPADMKVTDKSKNEPGKDTADKSDKSSKAEKTETGIQNKQLQSARNFELDRKISYVQKTPGQLIKLSAAVVIDDKVSYNKQGKATRTPLTEEEVVKITDLVKEAIGFDESRGDKVKVVNQSFAQPEPIAEIASVPFYKQGWFPSLIKQILAAIFILILVFIILRPIMKNLAKAGDSQGLLLKNMMGSNGNINYSQNSNSSENLPGNISTIKGMVAEDPKRVAQVVKNWVGSE